MAAGFGFRFVWGWLIVVPWTTVSSFLRFGAVPVLFHSFAIILDLASVSCVLRLIL